MKVFIADDEIYVIELIKRLIDWESMGAEIIGVATDGISAFHAICELHPDVVITDIRMPGYNGLVLIEKVQQQKIHTQFIVISGYKHFEYAQSAIKFGVRDYLLKPINASELTSIIKRIAISLNQNMANREKLLRQNSNYLKLKNKVHDFFISSIIDGSAAFTQDINTINAEYMLSFQPGSFQFLIAKLDAKNISNDFLKSLLSEVVYITRKHLQDHCHAFLYQDRGSRVAFLINYEKDRSLKQSFNNIIHELSNYCSKFGGISVSLGLGSVLHHTSELRSSYDEADNAVKSRIFDRNGKLIMPVPPINTEELLSQILSEDTEKALLKSIESSDFTGYKNLISGIFLAAQKIKIENASFYWVLCSRIHQLFWDATHFLYSDGHIPNAIQDLYELLEDCTNLSELEDQLLQNTVDLLYKYIDFNNYQANAPITIIKQYIKEHYAEKITLNDAAKLVHLNPVYFSILFKRKMNTNFVDYINEYRIETSKKMLQGMELSISEIADRVGIPDARYFSRLFKKHIGVTPKEYRNRHASGYKEQ